MNMNPIITQKPHKRGGFRGLWRVLFSHPPIYDSILVETQDSLILGSCNHHAYFLLVPQVLLRPTQQWLAQWWFSPSAHHRLISTRRLRTVQTPTNHQRIPCWWLQVDLLQTLQTFARQPSSSSSFCEVRHKSHGTKTKRCLFRLYLYTEIQLLSNLLAKNLFYDNLMNIWQKQ